MPDFDKLKPPDRGPPGSELLRPILRPPEKPKPRPTVDPSIAVDVGRLIGDTAKHYGGNLLDFLIGGHAPGSKYTGEGAAFKKLLEDLGGLVFPGRFVKAIFEIGEGEIPLTDKAEGRPGLGAREEGRIQAELEALREKLKREQLTELEIRRAIGRARVLIETETATAEDFLIVRGPSGPLIVLAPLIGAHGNNPIRLGSHSINNLIAEAGKGVREPNRLLVTERGDP